MESEITKLLKFIDDTRSKISLKDYLNDKCDFVEVGETAIGFSPFDDLKHDNYLDRRLMVHDNKYYCLSTGNSGDILDYLMYEKKLSFRDAIEEMAEIAGVKVPDFETEIEERVRLNEHKERLYRLMRDTMLHYYNNLRDPRAKIAVDYLEKRGFGEVLHTDATGKVRIDNDIVSTFALGYSIDERSLVDAMLKKGYTVEEMDECGLIYLRGDKAADVMAGRLIIPILNRHNKVIAFSGRIFEAKGHQKYRNTGNTILFSKKNELYGANKLPELAHNGKVADIFVVEGYMDVISLYKEGVKNAVASMGTALTDDHARILKNYSDNIYLTYDGDNAGQDAIRRGVDVLYAEGIIANVITLPGGQDPDEIIKEHGVIYFLDLKNEARNMIEFKIDDLANNYNLDDADDRGAYAVKASEIVLTYTNKVDGSTYLGRISEKSGISEDILQQELYASNVVQLYSEQNENKRTLTPKEQGIVYILYEMLRTKTVKPLAIYLDDSEERMAYDYMRLMGSGVSEEEFGEVMNGDIARAVSTIKKMDEAELEKASDDSYNRFETALIKDMNDEIFKHFMNEKDMEKKYILNQCWIVLTGIIKRRKTKQN